MGFEPTPPETGPLIQYLRPLGHTTVRWLQFVHPSIDRSSEWVNERVIEWKLPCLFKILYCYHLVLNHHKYQIWLNEVNAKVTCNVWAHWTGSDKVLLHALSWSIHFVHAHASTHTLLDQWTHMCVWRNLSCISMHFMCGHGEMKYGVSMLFKTRCMFFTMSWKSTLICIETARRELLGAIYLA